MNIEKLSVKELRELQDRIPKVIAEKQRSELAAVKAKMADIAAKQGFSLSEIIGKGGSKRRGNGAKFQSPDGKTWSVRGRRPLWLKGKDPEQFRVA